MSTGDKKNGLNHLDQLFDLDVVFITSSGALSLGPYTNTLFFIIIHLRS